MVSSEQIRAELHALKFLPGTADVSDEESLMDALVLDSLRLMQLVTSLESRFNFQVHQDDLAPENFETISNIVDYVNGKLGGNGG
jgi:acyl carrier protein